METANEKWKLEMELETETETQPPSYCSPSKISILLAFVLRYPCLTFLISLASFRGLCHAQCYCIGKHWGRQWLRMRLVYSDPCVKSFASYTASNQTESVGEGLGTRLQE